MYKSCGSCFRFTRKMQMIEMTLKMATLRLLCYLYALQFRRWTQPSVVRLDLSKDEKHPRPRFPDKNVPSGYTYLHGTEIRRQFRRPLHF